MFQRFADFSFHAKSIAFAFVNETLLILPATSATRDSEKYSVKLTNRPPADRTELAEVEAAATREGISASAWITSSMQKIEIQSELAIVVPEEAAILRIGEVAMNFEGVEMICEVDNRNREPDRMLFRNIDVF